MRLPVCVALLAVLVGASSARAARLPDVPGRATAAIRFEYRAHDGVMRPVWLLLPVWYRGQRIPLVISPHGRGVGPLANAKLFADLPAAGGFAVVNPGGEGRHTELYSWGAAGQIDDLAKMPRLVRALGVNVGRVFAFGGSMGGQETLLLAARHRRLLAGAAVFDAPTDMARRYRSFARLRDGAHLQALARRELGGSPTELSLTYALRSPVRYARALAFSNVPLQLFWSMRDRIVTDQRVESAALAQTMRSLNPEMPLWAYQGAWRHTAEMRAQGRLPRALARFGLLPWTLAPDPDDRPRSRPRA